MPLVMKGGLMHIDENVPLPPIKRYRFDRMKVGDSLFFETLSEVESAASAAYSYERTHNIGFKVTRRKVEGGYRLWRVA
jgi:hypothetical protein